MLTAPQILLLENLPGIGKSAIIEIDKYLTSQQVTLPSLEDELLDVLQETKKEYKRLRVPGLEDIQSARVACEHILDQSARNNIHLIAYSNPKFPQLLTTIKDRPLLLHCKGDLSSLQLPTVAIIGTREPSEHAKQAGPKLSSYFVDAGFTIVSGLAIGCDTIGHNAAVTAGKPTVAVLAGGLHSIYPKENKDLANKILETGGLLLSELPWGTNPQRGTFVERDRLQSGLSLGLVVLETGVTGGTLHTVGFAIQEKRPVACMFSHVKSKGEFYKHDKFQGNKKLVEEQKAIPLDSAEAIQNYIEQLLTLSQGYANTGNTTSPSPATDTDTGANPSTNKNVSNGTQLGLSF